MNDIAAQAVSSSGLENVVAAHTRLSDVDGEHGRLSIVGRPVEELAGRIPFEAAAWILFHDDEPTGAELARTGELLGEGRVAAFERLADAGDAFSQPDAMDALRAAAAHLSGLAGEDAYSEALRIAGALAVFAAAWACAARGATLAEPDPSAGHAADYLRLVRGVPAPPACAVALDAYLVTVIEHGMNASTFAARVVASTASDTVSAVVAALGALKGRLHGGAPGPVLDMLDAIGAPERARPWLEAALANHERIMGMGHRVYRARDPRAFVLERAIARLEATSNAGRRLALARAVEREAETLLAARHPDRPLKANVEFYTAVVLEAVDLPRTLFTATFAVSRVLGWCAHVDEQRRYGRLIRPQARYVPART